MTPCDPAAEVTLDVAGRPEAAGPAVHGEVFRSRADPTSFYCVFPLDEAPVQLRHAFRGLVGQAPLSGVAAVRGASQGGVGVDQYVVWYRVPGAGRSFAEALADPDPFARLDAATRVLRALPGWWDALGAPLLAMPADVVLTDAGPCLLPVPGHRLPSAAAVFRVPVRAAFLAPELVCGRGDLPWDDRTWRGVNAFAAGAALARCFHDPADPTDPADALGRAAVGLAAAPREDRCALPFWLRRVEAARQAVQLARDLAAPEPERRRAFAPADSAARLDQCRRGMDPPAAVRQAVAFETPLAAMQLLQDVLFTQETHDLLMLGGQLATRLDWPMAAIDFYERAVARQPDRPDAHEAQFALIASARDRPGLRQDHYRADGAVAADLEARLWRDFHALDHDARRQHEADLAKHLRWCGTEFRPADLVRAAQFIAPRLADPDGSYRWDAFELNLMYAEVLVFQAVVGDAAAGGVPRARAGEAAWAQLACMRQWLDWAEKAERVTPHDYDYYTEQAALLGLLLDRGC